LSTRQLESLRYNSGMPETPKKRLVLLDSHAILHRAYHALPEFSSKKGEPTGALYGLIAMLLKIVEELQPNYIVAAFDLPGATYRHEAYKQYKATRKELENDLTHQINRSRVMFLKLSIFRSTKSRASKQTICSEQSSRNEKNPDIEIVVASGDMDTLQLVDGKKGSCLHFEKGNKGYRCSMMKKQ
jgi:DNA polymerase-1